MTTKSTETEPVDSTRTAYCPNCDARYGRHADGACPQCGTDLVFEPDHAARIAAAFEVPIRDLAREHAPDSVCAMCTRSTPLALSSASDVSKADAFDALVDQCAAAIETVTGDHPYWLRDELGTTYTEAFYAACTDPNGCWVCLEAATDDDMACGHTEHGDPCPARGVDG